MNRILRLPTLALAALAFVFLATPVLAQAPKAGKYYEDNVDLGFKVKMPKDWEFTPPQPGEDSLIGKYTPARNRYINISPENVLWLEAYLVKFDRRKKAGDEQEEEQDASSKSGDTSSTGSPHTDQQKDLLEWLDGNMIGSGFRVKKAKDKTIGKVESTEFLIEGSSNGDPFHVYSIVYRLHADCDVAIVFNGPEDNKKWRKYESAAKSMAKSFKRLELEELELSEAKAGDHGLRSLKRAKLEKEVAMTPGWELYETENYFIISNNDDREFMKELQERLEAIRGVYETMYPFDEAARIKVAAAKRKAEEAKDDEEADEKPRETTSGYSSRQRSQCSVVRVCKNDVQYREYGGPGGSAGYWASFHEELVIYDDKEGGGRRNTWAVLNHEAFHQYIFYLYGSLAPHSWYNEGHGDFFSGWQYKHKKFVLKPFDWRQRLVQGMVRENKFVPLKEIVRFTQREYYSGSEYDTGPGEHYAQGWSFIWFLRTGRGKAPGWDEGWEKILPVYFEALASTEDLEAAIDQAFEGVDFEALTESWKAYTLK